MKALRNTAIGAIIALAGAVCASCAGSGSRKADSHELPPSEHSALLRLSVREGHTIAQIQNPLDSAHGPVTYLLPDRALPAATRDSLRRAWPDAVEIEVPLRRAVLFSGVQGSVFCELGAQDAVSGVMDARYFNVPELRPRIADGSIADCGNASSPSVEKILSLRPDAVILSVYKGMDVAGLDGLGLPLLRLVDNLEHTPLGRAEWIRLFGALTGEQQRADSLFSAVAASYTATVSTASRLSKHPKVLTDNIYQGVWYLPAGESFAARMIADAGGDYPWKDTPGDGSRGCTFEEVLDRAGDADVWVLRLSGVTLTDASLTAMDPRYAHLRPARERKIWYADSSRVPVFEEASYHPERLLADYARIFRAVANGEEPDSLRYFRRIE